MGGGERIPLCDAVGDASHLGATHGSDNVHCSSVLSLETPALEGTFEDVGLSPLRFQRMPMEGPAGWPDCQPARGRVCGLTRFRTFPCDFLFPAE